MKKLLDKLFKDHLKDLNTIPENIRFNQDLVKRRIGKELRDNKPWYLSWKNAATFLIIIGLSGICFYQHSLLVNRKEFRASDSWVSNAKKSESIATNSKPEQKATDKSEVHQRDSVGILRPIPRIEAQFNVITTIQPMVKCTVPAFITEKEIDQPEIVQEEKQNLSIFFESEKLALSVKETGKKGSFLKKIEKLTDN